MESNNNSRFIETFTLPERKRKVLAVYCEGEITTIISQEESEVQKEIIDSGHLLYETFASKSMISVQSLPWYNRSITDLYITSV